MLEQIDGLGCGCEFEIVGVYKSRVCWTRVSTGSESFSGFVGSAGAMDQACVG